MDDKFAGQQVAGWEGCFLGQQNKHKKRAPNTMVALIIRTKRQHFPAAPAGAQAAKRHFLTHFLLEIFFSNFKFRSLYIYFVIQFIF